MTEKLAAVLAAIYVPLMWVMVGVSGVLGVIGVLAPARLKGFVRMLTRNGPNRVLGVVMILVGTEMFIRGDNTAAPLLVKTLGVLMFVDGGVRLLIPTLSVIIAEWCVARTDQWYRVLGLVCLGVAYLFYHASRLPLKDVIEGINLHYNL